MIFQTFFLFTIIVNVLSSPSIVPETGILNSDRAIYINPYLDQTYLPYIGEPSFFYRKEFERIRKKDSDRHYLPVQTVIPGQTIIPQQTVVPGHTGFPGHTIVPGHTVIPGQTLHPSHSSVYPSQSNVYPPIYHTPSRLGFAGSVSVIADSRPHYHTYPLRFFDDRSKNQTDFFEIASPPSLSASGLELNPIIGLDEKPIDLLDSLISRRELLDKQIEYLSVNKRPIETDKAH